MNSIDRLYRLLENGIISMEEFEKYYRHAQQLKKILQEKQPAKTKERITSGR